MADHFLDDEAQELFGEIGIKLGGLSQRTKARNLHLFAGGIGGRHAVLGLVLAHRLGAFESLRQQMHQGGIDIVDAVSQPQKFWIGRGHLTLFIQWAAMAACRLVLSEGTAPAKFPDAPEKLHRTVNRTSFCRRQVAAAMPIVSSNGVGACAQSVKDRRKLVG